MKATVRTLQTLCFAFLCSVVLYAYVGETIYGKQHKALSSTAPRIYFTFTGLCVILIIVIGAIRKKLIAKTEIELAKDPENKILIRQLIRGYVLTCILSEGIALYSFVLRVFGFTFTQVATFYLAGFCLLLFSLLRIPSNLALDVAAR